MHGKTNLAILLAVTFLWAGTATAQNVAPVADAGLSRYVAADPIQLDGTGSFDPDETGPLSYAWTQISGPKVVIIDANTATPTIAGAIEIGTGRRQVPEIIGFTQTDMVQECQFALTVNDGGLMSLPSTLAISIVPDFGDNTLLHENPPFDKAKPTFIYFGGGNCVTGGGAWAGAAWAQKANIISFPTYGPDLGGGGMRTYYRYGDMIITYLSGVAPDYRQPIQTSGFSTGGQPAVDVGIHLNLTYQDPRYAINRVTFLDATPYCRSQYTESINAFLDSAVNGEQCWIDNYVTTMVGPSNFFHPDVLNVGSELSSHGLAPTWYSASLSGPDMNVFNHGVVAGAYWSVVGPGKNLQLASGLNAEIYKFLWDGSNAAGYLDFLDEPNHPGRLPEPVTLVGPVDVGDPTGAIFTCEESENAVGYELLFGADPYRIMDYVTISDSPVPPSEITADFPFAETWWTIRVRDAFGSTIYADPIRVDLENMPTATIENITRHKRYARIQHAITDAASGDHIVVGPGLYRESLTFTARDLTLRSTDPNDPDVVAATKINKRLGRSAVTVISGAHCVVAGFAITGNVEYWHGSGPDMVNCSILGDIIVRSVAENLTTGEKYAYIPHAIEQAESGDEIVVSEGICEANLDFAGKNMTIRSANPADPGVVAATVITGGAHAAVSFSSGENENCMLAGFTITGSNHGILCANASPTISGCRIVGNLTSGITVLEGGNPSISNCIISGNRGAGIEMWTHAGRRPKYSHATVTNCTITGNLHQGISQGMPTISNSIIYYNDVSIDSEATVICSNVQGSFPGEGNMDLPPHFASPGQWNAMETADNPDDDIWTDGDYHLKSQAGRWDQIAGSWIIDAVTSPCIDGGDPSSVVGSEPEPNGNIINMGAYGGTIGASKSP